MSDEISAQQFRYVLGNYPTGVALVTAAPDGVPVGMVVGTFTSVSLDPPLVGFLPARTSTTWPEIERAGSFVVNVLSSSQEAVCRDFAAKDPERFRRNRWRTAHNGAPILEDAVAHLECSLESVTDAGDHVFALGRVSDLSARPQADPLLFFHGGYGAFRAKSMLSYDVDVLRHIRLAARVKERIERTAQDHGCGCLVLAQVGTDLVVVSSFGEVKRMHNPAFAGLRQPFMAPLGMQFGAWLPDDQRATWTARLVAHLAGDRAAEAERLVDRAAGVVGRRGYTIACGPDLYVRLTELTIARTEEAAVETDPDLAAVAADILRVNDPVELADDETYDVFAMHAPVRLAGEITFSLGLYPLAEDLRGKDVAALGDVLLDLTAEVEAFLSRDIPVGAPT